MVIVKAYIHDKYTKALWLKYIFPTSDRKNEKFRIFFFKVPYFEFIDLLFERSEDNRFLFLRPLLLFLISDLKRSLKEDILN